MVRVDKCVYIDEFVSQVENVVNRGEQGKVYKIIKLVCGKYGGRKVVFVKDLQGRLFIIEREQEVCWVEYFKDVFNRFLFIVEVDI